MRLITALAAAVMLLSVASPAVADPRPGVNPTSPCVTPSEFYSIDKGGKTRKEVNAILDWEGRNALTQTADRLAYTWHVRLYRGCNGSWWNSPIWVHYKNGRVTYAAWLVRCRTNCVIELD